MLKLSATQKATKFQEAHVLFSGGTGSKSSFWGEDTNQPICRQGESGMQTHHKHELGMAETRLMGDLEPMDNLLYATFGHRQQQLEVRAGAKTSQRNRKVPQP